MALKTAQLLALALLLSVASAAVASSQEARSEYYVSDHTASYPDYHMPAHDECLTKCSSVEVTCACQDQQGPVCVPTPLVPNFQSFIDDLLPVTIDGITFTANVADEQLAFVGPSSEGPGGDKVGVFVNGNSIVPLVIDFSVPQQAVSLFLIASNAPTFTITTDTGISTSVILDVLFPAPDGFPAATVTISAGTRPFSRLAISPDVGTSLFVSDLISFPSVCSSTARQSTKRGRKVARKGHHQWWSRTGN